MGPNAPIAWFITNHILWVRYRMTHNDSQLPGYKQPDSRSTHDYHIIH